MRKEILYTKWILCDDGRFVIVEKVSRPYDGPWSECKKGRDTMSQNAGIAQGQAKTNNANSNASYNTAQNTLQEDLGSSTPGSLTPAATAQLASDRDQIASTYNGMRQTAFSTLGQRGSGAAPSGFTQAAINGVNQGEANADTGAYRNAQVNTQNERNFATGQESTLAGQQGQLGASNLGQSTNAAVALNKAGSTVGDILGGVAEAAPIIAAPFTGGASLMAYGLPGGAFSKMGQKGGGGSSGVGGYGPSTGVANAPYS